MVKKNVEAQRNTVEEESSVICYNKNKVVVVLELM
jgi:hypothetical protein